MNFDIKAIPTPYYIVDEQLLINNLQILQQIAKATNCKILLAQKAFSMFSLYPLISQYLHGTTASGLFEARLGYEEMSQKFGTENHIFSPAYTEKDFPEILKICDHIIFNSFNQWQNLKTLALSAGKSCGIRINPEHSTQEQAIYDPCSPCSRLGVTINNFRQDLLEGLEGLHFHTLCEQNSDALVETVAVIEKKFGKYLHNMKWLNLGGGHHITRPDYDIKTLIKCINHLQETYQVEIYLEPGEAVALNSGFLVTTILDIVNNGLPIAILDTSAACHMPDVLEMPYRPPILNSSLPHEKTYTYRLGGPTCLAGDIIGDYSFAKPLTVGNQLIFQDMAIYSMVKNNTFNGINLPTIALAKQDGTIQIIKQFNYHDFKNRLS